MKKKLPKVTEREKKWRISYFWKYVNPRGRAKLMISRIFHPCNANRSVNYTHVRIRSVHSTNMSMTYMNGITAYHDQYIHKQTSALRAEKRSSLTYLRNIARKLIRLHFLRPGETASIKYAPLFGGSSASTYCPLCLPNAPANADDVIYFLLASFCVSDLDTFFLSSISVSPPNPLHLLNFV